MLYFFYVEIKRVFRDFFRYPLDSLSAIFMFYVILSMLIGAARINATQFQLSRLIISYAEWIFIIPLISDPASEIELDIVNGRLAKILLAGSSFVSIVVVRAISGLLLSAAWSFSVFISAIYIFKVDIFFAQLRLVELILPMIQALGLGLILAGFSMVYKRSRNFTAILPFFLMPIWVFGANAVAMGEIVPYLPVVNGLKIFEMDGAVNFLHLGKYMLLSLAWIAGGAIFLHACKERERKLGTLWLYAVSSGN